MPNVPSTTAPADGWADNPIIDTAEAALRAFGDNLSRAHAATLLSMWRHRPELTDREVTDILDRFPS